MTHFHLFRRDDRPGHRPERAEAARAPLVEAASPSPDFEPDDDDRVGRPARLGTTRAKLVAGGRGIKHAIRSDSSFFAHGYRGLLIVLTAALLNTTPIGWCFLVVSAALVLLAEMTQAAVRAVVGAMPDPDCPELRAAEEIAAAGVLVASITSAILTTTVLVTRLAVLLGW